MKVYTKTGDKGSTALIGGTRVPKHHIRIEAYGTIDELNSHVGLLRDLCKNENARLILKEIQDRLFTIGASLASDPEKSKMKIPDLKEEDVLLLENQMDMLNEHLPDLKHFVLPGGHPAVSQAHICRCVCRRAERCTSHLAEIDFVAELVIIFINRLSDYFFVLARALCHWENAEEIAWLPRLEK